MRAMERGATLSDDAVYRYDLTRTWGAGARATFVVLNLSTADHQLDDPTVSAVVHFARSLAHRPIGAVTIVNLFGLRATEPAALPERSASTPPDPVPNRPDTLTDTVRPPDRTHHDLPFAALDDRLSSSYRFEVVSKVSIPFDVRIQRRHTCRLRFAQPAARAPRR